MNRSIVTESNKKVKGIQVHPFDTPEGNINQGSQKPDSYFGRLIKYVPTEVIAVYMVLSSIVQMDISAYRDFYNSGVLLFGLIGTYVWLTQNQKVKNKTQLLLSCMAFLAWAISVSTPPFYIHSTLKALIAPVTTFLIAAFKPESDS